MILSGSVEKTYPSCHGGGGGGSGVAGADRAGVGLAVAADEVGPEDVGGGGEERSFSEPELARSGCSELELAK